MGSIQTELSISSQHVGAFANNDERAIRLDLGCGANKRNDFKFIGIDKFRVDGVDIRRDIEKQGIPFGDETVDFIFASHFLEHVDDLIFVMEEIWRVLKPDGILEIISPQGNIAKSHPDHKREIYEGMWGWWNPITNNSEWSSLGVKARFRRVHKCKKEGEGLFSTLLAVKTEPSIHAQFELTSTRNHSIDLHNPKSVKLDIGCGDRKRSDLPTWIGVDNYPYEGVNVVRDAERGLPFGDNSIDHVYASHFLEHPTDLNFVMFEIWRVMKPSAIFDITSPLWTTKYAYAHPDHKRLIHPDIWAWWKPSADKRDTEAYGEKAEFQTLKNYEEGEGLFTRLVAIKY